MGARCHYSQNNIKLMKFDLQHLQCAVFYFLPVDYICTFEYPVVNCIFFVCVCIFQFDDMTEDRSISQMDGGFDYAEDPLP